ncbi:hypothetical protein [Mangrovimonas sp. YM274]|uniref:hypothetical protein n=1 Tax=Mangrovimonas sp. YM274 TaxID=3070660 RepID=UPI0027DCC2C2|nr:hypothetical protein [Mangrovimonas sp. YM274]WMI68555.1 hypothetical protein RBH95_15580 [Mangrovimonas sp. YM274]
MKVNGIIPLVMALCLSVVQWSLAQETSPKGNVVIDGDGVMRWEHTKEEVFGFGVNYTVPFAHAYRSAKRMGIDPKKAIDSDIYHFTRLGFDLYRIHVWDTQISDVEGNLLENEYLDTFDYLLSKLKAHNINYVITPIAFWGDGWPEPDGDTPGFSHTYGKADCLTNPEAIKAQQNYLFQFLNHVNPYTGVAYKDEPNIIAFEVSNEPHHQGTALEVTAFVKGMVEAMRKTGTQKPIFYNMSHAVHFMDAYFEGGAQGGTFQWYPTGLGYGKELSGNVLPNVNDYDMPFDEVIKKHQGAKLVYEFDAADVGKSYVYPAMARSFRSAGIQIGTHFAYDPTYLAYANTEYNTHYMNLNYTPSKALALKICAEVFHEIPLYAEFGKYPENTSFGNFKIDYKTDLAEYNSEEKFFYTNTTSSNPKNLKKLEEIAGYGSSPVVTYDGQGAYFMDKLSKGVWRLEVQPDAIWVDNPFGKNSPKKTVAVINWETHSMSIDLKDLGEGFSIEAINEGNGFQSQVTGKVFSIQPGTYIISKKGSKKTWSVNDAFKTNKLNDFYAPKTTVDKPWLRHEPIKEVTENTALQLEVQYVAPNKPKSIQLLGYSSKGRFQVDFKNIQGYRYTATLPAEYLQIGFVHYNIVVKSDDTFRSYPANMEGKFSDWDFYDIEDYVVKVVSESNPIYLFDAEQDTDDLVRPWRKGFKLVPTEENGQSECQMNLEQLFVEDSENRNATPIYDYSFKHFIIDKIDGRQSSLKDKATLVFKGRSLTDKPLPLQIAFVMEDGSSYGGMLTLEPEMGDYTLSLSELKPVKTVTLPRPYPSFLPYYLEHDITSKFDVNNLESLQFSIGPGIPENQLRAPHGIGMVSVRLE